MPQFKSLEECQEWKLTSFHVPSDASVMSGGRQEWKPGAVSLWENAKKSFYYKNDMTGAEDLCRQIIARFGLSAEADDAKLLLHDIGIENKKKNIAFQNAVVSLTRNPGECLYCSRETTGAECVNRCTISAVQENDRRETGDPWTSDKAKHMSISAAIAVVGLPIIGIAQGGIVGIAVPQIFSLLISLSVAWTISKIKALVYE